MVFPPGVFITMMPRFVAASTSTLSTPTPARPMTFSFVPASITLAVTFVSLRTTSASKSPMISSNCSGFRPIFTVTSSKPPFDSSSIPRCAMGSATSTLGVVMAMGKRAAIVGGSVQRANRKYGVPALAGGALRRARGLPLGRLGALSLSKREPVETAIALSKQVKRFQGRRVCERSAALCPIWALLLSRCRLWRRLTGERLSQFEVGDFQALPLGPKSEEAGIIRIDVCYVCFSRDFEAQAPIDGIG